MTRRAAVLRRVLSSRRLRSVELAFLGFSCAEHGTWVSILVYAYERGGTSLAAVIAVVQLLPAAAVAPWASRLTDRRGGAAGLWTGYVAQALGMGVTAAVLLADAPPAAAYAGAILAASAITLTRPAQAALLPELAADPAELTAANAMTGWLESVSVFIGPALAGVLIGIDGPGASFALFAGACALSALLVTPIARAGRRASADEVTEGVAEDVAALAALRSEPATLGLLGVMSMQFVAYGAFDVLVVVLAIEALHIGASGAGYLNAAFGAGGVAGGAAVLLLVGRERLVPPLLGATAAWGAAFLLIGLLHTVPGAFVLMGAAGIARMVLDVAGRTLLQRAVPDNVRGRVFGVLEGVSMLSLAAGSLLVPALAAAGGARVAVGGVGVLLLAAVAALARAMGRLDRIAPSARAELAALRASPLFGVLAPPALEGLARSLVRVDVAAGEAIVREGEPGDRFYLVAEGAVLVTRSGMELARLTAGAGFGEIALLRDGVRTSTVTATEPTTLYALERAPFLEVMTQHPQTRSDAEQLADARLQAQLPVRESGP